MPLETCPEFGPEDVGFVRVVKEPTPEASGSALDLFSGWGAAAAEAVQNSLLDLVRD